MLRTLYRLHAYTHTRAVFECPRGGVPLAAVSAELNRSGLSAVISVSAGMVAMQGTERTVRRQRDGAER